jgi:hypothetical protein
MTIINTTPTKEMKPTLKIEYDIVIFPPSILEDLSRTSDIYSD